LDSHRLLLALTLLGIVVGGVPRAQAMYSVFEGDHAAFSSDETAAELTQFAQAQPLPSPSPTPSTQPAAQPSPSPASADEPIGNVATLTGTATVIRNKDSIALKLKDDIFLNDTVQTSSGASLGITFNDDTTFHLSANAKITIDSYVYEAGGSNNTGIFDVGKGTVAFVAAAVAKTGNMQINTPAASLGIRGTTGLVEVPEDGTGASSAQNIKLYPDADGRVGRIEVSDRQGARLGTLTQGASGFAVRPGIAGARATAAPLNISTQQAARDRGFVSQVHQAQTVGRQIVTEQRAIRRANPPQPGQGPRQQPQQRQPGQQQPGAPKTTPQPGTQKGQKQTPGVPNGQKQPPKGQKQPPGAPNRQGQQQPRTPSQPGTLPTPNRQGAQQPGAPQSPAQPTGPLHSGQGQQPGVQGQHANAPRPAAQPRSGNLQQNAPSGLRAQPQRGKPPPLAPKGKQKKQQ
jgi:hypothetical protein